MKLIKFGLIPLFVGALLTHSATEAMSRKATPEPTPSVSVTATPIATPSAPPAGPGHIGFNCVTCTATEKKAVARAELLANQIVRGECFKQHMLSWGLIWTEGKTDDQVLDHLRSANLTVPVHYYFGKCSVHGYRNVGAPDIYFNRCAHQYYSDCDTASNGTHEWSHVLGYGHPFRRTRTRGQTVPYAINNGIEKCCRTAHGYRMH